MTQVFAAEIEESIASCPDPIAPEQTASSLLQRQSVRKGAADADAEEFEELKPVLYHVQGHDAAETAETAQVPPDTIYEDHADAGCHVGSSCTSGGVPAARGACVVPMAGPGTGVNECWDVCNLKHPPESYHTGVMLRDHKISKSIHEIRMGVYPHVICPNIVKEKEEANLKRTEDVRKSEEMAASTMEKVRQAQETAKKANVAAEYAEQASAAAHDEAAGPEEAERAKEALTDAVEAHKLASAKAAKAAKSVSNLARVKAKISHAPGNEESEQPLSEAGYHNVASMKDHDSMDHFIRRVVAHHGCHVKDEGALAGMIPYYSGHKAHQTFAALDNEVKSKCAKSGTWLEPLHGTKFHPESNAMGSTPAEAPGMAPVAATQHAESAVSVSSMSSQSVMSAQDVAEPVIAETAPLDEEGYTTVAGLQSQTAMEKFMRRVIDNMGMSIEDDAGLMGMVPFYSGEKGVRSYAAMKSELEKTAKKKKSWLKVDPSKPVGAADGSGSSMQQGGLAVCLFGICMGR